MTSKVLVSRCLLGHRVRYDGGASGPYQQLATWQAEGQGEQVLEGIVPVVTDDGEDVSQAFIDGAHQALELVQRHDIRIAVLKANSPSCGNPTMAASAALRLLARV